MGSYKSGIQQRIPFLPTVLTLASIVCGMTAIMKVARVPVACGFLEEEAAAYFSQGCWLIFAAMLFDVMDGKIARAMDAVSAFGKELDSLADVISFGVAPGFIAHRFLLLLISMSGREEVKSKFLLVTGISLVFVLCAAIRLARYNVETKKRPPEYITGMPSPGAAGFIIANILFFISYQGFTRPGVVSCLYFFQSVFPFAILVASLLMVSRVTFVHVGNMIATRMKSFSFLVLTIFFIPVVIWKPIEVFFIANWTYLLACLIPGVREYVVRRRKRRGKEEDEEEGDTFRNGE